MHMLLHIDINQYQEAKSKHHYYYGKDSQMSEALKSTNHEGDISPFYTLRTELFRLQYPLATEKDETILEALRTLYKEAIERARAAGLTDEDIRNIINLEDDAFSASFPEL